MQNIESMPRPEIILVADTVAREKNIDKEDVFTAMEVAIQKAGRSKYGFEHDIRANIDRKTGAISLARYREVVEGPENVENEVTQLTLEDAKMYDANAKVGDFIIDQLPPIDFGRIAAQTAKQVIVQKVRDAERNKQFEEYKEKSARLSTARLRESSSATLFWTSAKPKPFCAATKSFRGKSLRTATASAHMFWTFGAKTRARRFFCPVPVRNLWPSCSRRKFRKFMTVLSKLWALPAIRGQKPKSPLKPTI